MAGSAKYIQIADDLRRRIESHEFAADVPLPTETSLQGEYQASRNTVREAVKLLVQQHLLETRAGQGTFITREIVPFFTTLSTDPTTGVGGGGEGATYPALIREQGREAGAATPEVAVLNCPAQMTARLGIEEGELVVSRRQERYIDGTVWSRWTTYYPMRWVDMGATGLLIPRDIPEGAVDYLFRTIGLRQVGYRDLVSARLPDDTERALFSLTLNHTVIEICRTSYAEDTTPIRVTITVFPSDRNQLVYEIGAVPDSREGSAQP